MYLAYDQIKIIWERNKMSDDIIINLTCNFYLYTVKLLNYNKFSKVEHFIILKLADKKHFFVKTIVSWK